MPTFDSAAGDSKNRNELVKKAQELVKCAAKGGNDELTKTARELEKAVTDYVLYGERKYNVLKAFDALSELLNSPEFKKAVFIELIVKLMFELFLYLTQMHV